MTRLPVASRTRQRPLEPALGLGKKGMEKELHLRGKSVLINLAQVKSFKYSNLTGISEVVGRGRKLRVTLRDGSDIIVERDDDMDGFIAAMYTYLGCA